MPKQEDTQYIDEVLKGDSSSFAVLVERHKEIVFNICIKILGNQEEAEEVAQDTFVKAFEKLNTFKKEAKFSTWLFRIAYNMSISHQRRLKAKQLDVVDYFNKTYAEDEVLNALDVPLSEELETRLKSAISKLDGLHQLLLQLYYDQDLSMLEVAEITNLTESNVKVKIHRARQKLFQLMKTNSTTKTV